MSQLVALLDQFLTEASSMYIPENYICEQVLPYVGVSMSTGRLAKYGTNHLRIENTLKAGRGKYRRVEAIVRSNASYSIDGHGLEGLVTTDDYRNVQEPYDAERDETIGITTMIWLEKEQVLANALTATATMTQNTTLSGTSQFNDYDNSNPLGQFNTARASVYSGCGKAPNTVIMSWLVRNTLKFHPALLDYLGFKWDRPGGLSDDELARALDVKKVLVGDAVYESAKEGQTSSLTPVWGKHIIFAYAPDQAAPYQQSLGYRLGYKDKAPRQVWKWTVNNPPQSTAILVEDSYQFLLSNVLAGYLIANAIA